MQSKSVKTNFHTGISKITLFDSNSNILAQRLVFIDVDYGNTVKVDIEKEEYSTREKVRLDIETILSSYDSLTSTLSVSVVSEDYLSAAGMSQNIKSYLLLDSELKGAIESPALYFIDEENITAAEKLNLLMMVQGWRSYYWDEIIGKMPENLTGWDDAGLTISGRVKRLFRDKNVVGGKVTLTSFSPKLVAEETTTDSLGRFNFDRIFLWDPGEIIISGKNEKGKRNVEIMLDQDFNPIEQVALDPANSLLGNIIAPLKYYRGMYLQKYAKNSYTPETGSIVLDDIEVIGNKKEAFIERWKQFGTKPDRTFYITKDDYKYINVYGFLQKKLNWDFVGKYYASFDKISGEVRYYSRIVYTIDFRGVDSEYVWDAENYPLKDIYRIDIVRKSLFSRVKVRAYVSIYSNYVREGKKVSVRGNKILKVNGFDQPSKFYSPKYTLENINNEIPDYRPTLYWSPEVAVKGGKANIEFFTCDKLSRYVIIVEGISKNGKVCYGTGRFSVTDFNPATKK